MPNIYDLLEQDHRKVKEIFNEIHSASAGNTRERLFSRAKQELEIHSAFEEQVFYPKAREATGMDDQIKHSLQEHAQVKQMLEQLSNKNTSSPEWIETLKKLSQAVQHHVQEEEGKLIPAARKSIDDTLAETMAHEYQERKQRALEEA